MISMVRMFKQMCGVVILALGLQQGTLHLMVRPEGDVAMKPMEMASFRKLFK